MDNNSALYTSKILNRFTDLDTLAKILKNRTLRFSNPLEWKAEKNARLNDITDAKLLERYKHKKQLAALFVLCFSAQSETIAFWNDYADNGNGCCIQFNKEKLIQQFSNMPKIRHREVSYYRILDSVDNVHLDEIPFCKRWPYRAESEYRFILESDDRYYNQIQDISLSCISRITFGPNVSDEIFAEWRKRIENSFIEIRVNRSNVHLYEKWLGKFNKILN